MLISRRRNFIFIHIYKNAGTSITNALKPYAAPLWQRVITKGLKKIHINPSKFDHQPYPSHITASELVEILGKRKFNSYFSFAFVRNPWDWQVSLYKYMIKKTDHAQHDLVKSFKDFDEYIKWRCNEEVRFQKDFIYSEKGEQLVDFVGRFESLDRDFKKICSRIGIDTFLPKMNVSNKIPYQDFYNNETKELVEKTFHPDIELFNYSF